MKPTALPSTPVIFWFRRDLRLVDNAGLYHALKENIDVLPLFIFDTTILDKLEEKADSRVDFIHHTLTQLSDELSAIGSPLVVLHGKPAEIFADIRPRAVYTNQDYEPEAIKRDDQVKNTIERNGGRFHAFKDQVIFEKHEVCKDDGTPYTVFTPYMKRWKSLLTTFYTRAYPTKKYFGNFIKLQPQPIPTLEDIGFKKSLIAFPPRVVRQSVITRYKEQRDFPAVDGTTRLSVHLRFGTVSIRQLVKIALAKNETWLNELIWREFYQMILWHFPHVVTQSFKPAYDRIGWRNDPDEFNAWCEGRTGYPIVDAGMRELNATGFMHNRVRMIVASFLTKHLLIDWRWGEAYFARKLLDYDLASNNGGWQWAAGSGCDAAPYFRVFNPALQTVKFDPDHAYIRKWVPEEGTAAYPKPIVEHFMARDRVLKIYREALG